MTAAAWSAFALALLALRLQGPGSEAAPRGIRNNNPGNIRRTGTDWRGAVPGGDPEFVTFEGPEWGLRALIRTLYTYRDRHGLRTVREIITRWAPPKENDTQAYIFAVAARIGVDPDDPLVFAGILPDLAAAIVHHENGENPYPPELYRYAWELSGHAPGQVTA